MYVCIYIYIYNNGVELEIYYRLEISVTKNEFKLRIFYIKLFRYGNFMAYFLRYPHCM